MVSFLVGGLVGECEEAVWKWLIVIYCTPNSCADATSADVAMMIVVSNLFTISLPFYSFITIFDGAKLR